MKHIDFEFNGKTYALSFTVEALFTLYDKFGVCDDIVAATQCLEPTAEGWKNCCWLAALMATQGELQRRSQGYDRQAMLTMEELRTGFMAAEHAKLRMAVRKALEQGFTRDIPDPDREQEVNLVLQEREASEKKRNSWCAPRSIPCCHISHPSPPAPRRPDALPRNLWRHAADRDVSAA